MNSTETRQAAFVIAKQLNENKQVISKFVQLIDNLGLDLIQTTVEEALETEKNGGLMTSDKSRRRTPGGVFFVLLKAKLTEEQMAENFPPPNWKDIRKKRKQAKKAREAKKKSKEGA